MRRPVQLHFQVYRLSLVLLVAFIGPLMCAELKSSFVRANRASSEPNNSKRFSAGDSIATYRWNLNDEDLPATSSINTIADARDRTIAFNYTDDHVSSITQTWKVTSVKLRRTWTVTTDSPVNTLSCSTDPIGVTPTVKHIPTNATKPTYTEAMAASDSQLASVFGGSGAVAAANGFEPPNLGTPYPLYRGDLIDNDGQIRRGHLSYAMHLYGSADGTRKTELYVPRGFTSHSNIPTPTDAAVTFYYPRLGKLTDVTLAVFHVDNFHLSYEGDRVRIGDIGGPGGSVVSYRHSHLEFYHGDTGLPPVRIRAALRIDPTSIFETPQASGIASARP